MKNREKMSYSLMMVVIFAALVIIVAHNYVSYSSSMEEDVEMIGAGSLAQATEQMEAYLAKGINVMYATAITVDFMLEQGATAGDVESLLTFEAEKYRLEIDESFSGIYGLIDGTYVDGIGWVPDEGYEPRERDWYIAALQAQGEPTLVSPYLDAQTGTVMMSVSQLLSDGESVVALDIGVGQLRNIAQDIQLNGLGYGFVVDSNGFVIAHNNQSEEGRNYLDVPGEMRDLLERVYAQETVCFQSEIDGDTCMVFADTVLDGWRVVLIVTRGALLRDVRIANINNVILCTMISLLLLAFCAGTFKKMHTSILCEKESARKIVQMNKNTIRALARTIDAKDRYTNGHSSRVADYAMEIARRMNKSEEEQETVYYAGLLHDVGKIRIPEEVINKPGKPTEAEYEQIKIHPVTGYHILKDIYDDGQVANAAKFHHERYDGAGYPNGLKGENIPEIARIIAVADTYDAMASNRSYRAALPQNVIRSEIEKGKGTQFDPDIADIMLQMIDEDRHYTMKELDLGQRIILVVDDEPMNIKMTELILKDKPRYLVIGASSGEEALDILTKTGVDLILLDVKMPGMDGFETLARIREHHQIPVAFMTGEKNIETLQRASEFGVDDYITKPFLPLALKETVHSILYH